MLLGLNGVEKPAQLFYSFKQINTGASIHMFVSEWSISPSSIEAFKKNVKSIHLTT